MSLQHTILNDDHSEPHICVTCAKTGQVLSQCFNFLDHIGGKQAITSENVKKFLMMRGILVCTDPELIKSQKSKEAHQFLTESSHLAGDDFQLDKDELRKVSDFVKEMDTIDVLQLDPATFKYPDGLTHVMREVEDPFKRDI